MTQLELELKELGLMGSKPCRKARCGYKPLYKFWSDRYKKMVSICLDCRNGSNK